MAIIKIRNAAIDLDAAEIPNLPATKITSGTLATARLGSGTASGTTFLAGDQTYKTAATEFNDDKLVNDISTLALHQATNNNSAKYNLTNSNVDVYQDSSAITNLTNCARDTTGEYVSSVNNVADANTKALWTTTIDSHGDAIGGSGEGTPIVDATGTLQLQSTNTGVQTFSSGEAAPLSSFGTRSIKTAAWSTSTDYGGLFIREKSGQTSDLNFGTGALTIEMFVKQVSTGFTTAHQYVFDLQNGSNHRISMAPNSTTNSSAFNGSLMSDGDYSWSNFGVGNWRHVALVRDGSGNIANFINGTRVQAATGKTENLSMTDSNELSIGQRLNGENSAYLYINNIRFSNIARYSPTSSSLTVPTSRFEYLTSTVSATGNYESTAQTANSSVNKISAVVTYTNQSGTNTLNTDIVLQVSADNGSNWSNATLTSAGTFSTGVLQAVTNDISVTAGTQLKYKIFFANQASGSKEARINGVSLSY